jgi:potassium efflux system protein
MSLASRRCALWILLVLAGTGFLWGQETGDVPLDPAEVRDIRDQVAADTEIDPTLRDAKLALLNDALVFLDAVATDQSIARGFQRELAGVENLRKALDAELQRAPRVPRVPLADNATLERAEATLARERAHLRATREELRRAEGKIEERSRRRNEIAAGLGSLDQSVVSLDDQLRSGQLGQSGPELASLARARLMARREALKAHTGKLRAEMELLEARGIVVPLEVDLAQRRVAIGERLVPLVEERTISLRRSSALAALERVRSQVAKVMLMAPVLAEVAAETQAMAEEVWGTEGVAAESAEVARTLARTRKYQSDLDRIVELTRRRFAAFGYTGSIQRWWPHIPEDFPPPGEIARQLAELGKRLPEVQHQLISLEQSRSNARAQETRVLASITAIFGDEESDAFLAATRLLEQRRELLDALINSHGRYADRLVELQTVGTYFLEDTTSIETFLYEHLLWARSVPKPILPQPGAMLDGFWWLNSWENWSSVFSFTYQRAREYPGRLLVFLLTLGLLLGLRKRVRRRVERLGRKVEEAEQARLLWTLETLLHTVFLAAPVPLALFTLHVLLSRAGDSVFLFSAALALWWLTSMAALMELMRQVLVPHGLGESHFGWPSRITRRLYSGLFWPEILFLIMMEPALHLAMAGTRLSSPEELQSHSNSLGRVAFMLAMSVFGIWLLTLLSGRRAPGAGESGTRSPIWDRLYVYAYPIIVLAILLPVVLAAFGYYISALLLSYQVLRTLWLALLLLLFGAILFRWCQVVSLRPALESAQPPKEVADAQVRSMFRFMLVAFLAVGLYFVWADALPTLQVLKRVQIWPTMTVLEDSEQDSLPVGHLPVAVTEGEGGAPAAKEGEPSSALKIPGLPAGPGTSATAAQGQATSSLTLWALMEAFLVILITVQVVKNLPGLLQLTLQRRSMMDSGARIAIATLVRYAAIIIGVSAAFSLLGISWSRIQWLAAALTFGLGFGLQEIVANFVSGLILLTERPVRVGDAVTIGNLQGQVARIQIRATTVTLWDRSEMIVPNKEFITTKLINWTLTDSRRRLDLPVRVAYGSDLPLVKKTLLDVALANPNVMKDPPSKVLLLEFGEDALKLELRSYVDFGMGLTVKDALHMAIDQAFREHGIEFALPRLSVDVQRRAGRKQLPPAQPGEPSEV